MACLLRMVLCWWIELGPYIDLVEVQSAENHVLGHRTYLHSTLLNISPYITIRIKVLHGSTLRLAQTMGCASFLKQIQKFMKLLSTINSSASK